MKTFLNEFFDTNTMFLIIFVAFLMGFFLGIGSLREDPIIIPDQPKQNQYLCLESKDCRYIETYLNEGYYSVCLDHQCESFEIEQCDQMCNYEPTIF